MQTEGRERGEERDATMWNRRVRLGHLVGSRFKYDYTYVQLPGKHQDQKDQDYPRSDSPCTYIGLDHQFVSNPPKAQKQQKADPPADKERIILIAPGTACVWNKPW